VLVMAFCQVNADPQSRLEPHNTEDSSLGMRRLHDLVCVMDEYPACECKIVNECLRLEQGLRRPEDHSFGLAALQV
jgi:hypothetical protein